MRLMLLALAAAVVALVLHAHVVGAAYSCCSDEQRGTVCTLAGSGDPNSLDSTNATKAAFYHPHSVALRADNSIIIVGSNEQRLRIDPLHASVRTMPYRCLKPVTNGLSELARRLGRCFTNTLSVGPPSRDV